ncbi:methyl-accepting chemotaxis protein McpB [Moorella thermoacetica]|uniref:Methyl-accepting chemotaxis protein McpB n=1 Tax=Neomoorella thermoacetica TaxID=1525 RepID=A0A1J5JXN7_NEOTH|nr:methyl-accepting chemotaxis protein [Moorella thermoacetica]OIQ08313.1 methyl-accepting chemotaxis protein McpB [Moorella thermoacetica]
MPTRQVKFMNSIGARLLLWMLVLALIPLAALGFTNYYVSLKDMGDQSRSSLARIDTLAAQMIDDWLNEKIGILQSLAKDPVFQTGDQGLIMAFLKKQGETAPYAEVLIWAGPDGKGVNSLGATPDVSDRDYFQAAINGRVAISNLTVSKTTGNKVIFIAVPVPSSQGTSVLAMSLKSDTLLGLIDHVKYGQAGYAYMVDSTGMVMAHPDKERVMKEILTRTESESLNRLAQKMLQDKQGGGEYIRNGINKLVVYAPVKTAGWIVALTTPDSEVFAGVNAMRRLNLAIILLVALAVALLAVFISRQIARPVIALAGQADILATGNLQVDIDASYYGELGILSRSLKAMVNNFRDIVRKVQDGAAHLASSAQELSASTEEASRAVEQVAAAVQDMAKGANEQAVQAQNITEMVQGIAADIGTASSMVQEIAASSQQVRRLISDGLNAVEDQDKKMTENVGATMNASEAVRELVQQAGEVGGILKTIASLAEQTNLLALNAAIEAARAGEHGRGFAVVAEEVRKLAEESAQATKEIEEIVAKIQSGARGAAGEMEKAQAAVEAQKAAVQHTDAVFQDIARETQIVTGDIQKMVTAIEGIKDETQHISEAVQAVAAAAEENGASAEEISASSEEQNATVEEIAASANELANLGQELQQVVARFKL